MTAEDDCAEEDLGDVVVEDLLIAVRSVSVTIVFGPVLIDGAEGFCCVGYVRWCGHGL